MRVRRMGWAPIFLYGLLMCGDLRGETVWVGDPDMIEAIRSINPELGNFNGNQCTVPVFTSLNGPGFFFTAPFSPEDVAEETIVGDAQFGSGWFRVDQNALPIHLGTDLGINEDGKSVYSMSNGTIVALHEDSSGWGCHVIIRHELERGQEYPIEKVNDWQDANAKRLRSRDGRLETIDGRELVQGEEVFPRGAEVRLFSAGFDESENQRYLYFDYMHIVPGGATSSNCAGGTLQTGQNVESGDLLGAIDSSQETPHLHLQAKYSSAILPNEESDEIMAGAALFRTDHIFENGSIVSRSIDRYRDNQGTLVAVNPLRLAYTPRSCAQNGPCIGVAEASWSNGSLRVEIDGVGLDQGGAPTVTITGNDREEVLAVEEDGPHLVATLPTDRATPILDRRSAEIRVQVGQEASLPVSIPFRDVPQGEWYEEPVVDLWTKGIVKGRRPGYFEPASLVNRVEFLKMLLLVMREAFPDLGVQEPDDTTPWYGWYLEEARRLEEVDDPDTAIVFWQGGDGVGLALTRCEMARMAYAAFHLGTGLVREDESTRFTDLADCPYQHHVMGLEDAQYVEGFQIEGDSEHREFRPAQMMNRAEAAMLLREFLPDEERGRNE